MALSSSRRRYCPGHVTKAIESGKPWQHGCTESFNGKFRDACLSREWFRSQSKEQAAIEIWRQRSNEARPHPAMAT